MSVFSSSTAVLGTRHGKEGVIVPVLEEKLGMDLDVLDSLDTDRFGTFTGEVPRIGHPRETARAKALAAIFEHGRTSIGIASEGSFGPHPGFPFVAGGAELVLLVDRDAGLELVGIDVTMETNFGSKDVGSVEEALVFAERALFPSHGVIVMPCRAGAPVIAGVVKGIVEAGTLEQAVRDALRTHGRAWIEADMRAHLNPTRMQSIERATRSLASAALSACPYCGRPGYVAIELVRGLLCSDCDLPTERVRAEVLGCAGCGRREERTLPGRESVSPSECPYCNP